MAPTPLDSQNCVAKEADQGSLSPDPRASTVPHQVLVPPLFIGPSTKTIFVASAYIPAVLHPQSQLSLWETVTPAREWGAGTPQTQDAQMSTM